MTADLSFSSLLLGRCIFIVVNEAVLMPSGTRVTVINGNSVAHLYRYYAIVNTFARGHIWGVLICISTTAVQRSLVPLYFILSTVSIDVSNSLSSPSIKKIGRGFSFTMFNLYVIAINSNLCAYFEKL